MDIKSKRYILSAVSLIMGLNLSTFTPVNAASIRAVCERPTFKLWKTQQSNRLWMPSSETLLAERSGKVFTYNCFTSDEIDQFFASHEERIENAHFYPIMVNDSSHSDNDDEGECD